MKRSYITIPNPANPSLDLKLSARLYEIVQYVFDNPSKTQRQLAQHFGVSDSRISAILRSDKVLSAFPILARRKIKGLVPKATKRLEQLMNQGANLAVSEKVVSRVLETQKVLNNEINVVHSINSASIEELQRIVSGSQTVPSNAIDAELVSDSTEDAKHQTASTPKQIDNPK